MDAVMPILNHLVALGDMLLMAPFRCTGEPLGGFYLGTAVLTLLCAVAGEFSMAGVYLFNRRHYDEQNREMVRMHNLSIAAIEARDKASYKASNSLANEHFGKAFFASAALFATSLWPLPFALAWLGWRFSGVDIALPLTPWAVGYPAIAIPLYILARIGFSFVRKYIPVLARVRQLMRDAEERTGKVRSWSEIGAQPTTDAAAPAGSTP